MFAFGHATLGDRPRALALVESARARRVDRQTRRLVDHDRLAVDEQDEVFEGHDTFLPFVPSEVEGCSQAVVPTYLDFTRHERNLGLPVVRLMRQCNDSGHLRSFTHY